MRAKDAHTNDQKICDKIKRWLWNNVAMWKLLAADHNTLYSNMQHKPRSQYPGDKWETVNQLRQDMRRESRVLKVFSSQITFSQDRRKSNSCHLWLTVRKETDIQLGPTSSVWVNTVFFQFLQIDMRKEETWEDELIVTLSETVTV